MSDVIFPKCPNCGSDLLKPVGKINDETEIICSACDFVSSYRNVKTIVAEKVKKATLSEIKKRLKGTNIKL